ncbi:hypothetical protein VTI74DRAFT_5624 [Chaetomium olivicolor]
MLNRSHHQPASTSADAIHAHAEACPLARPSLEAQQELHEFSGNGRAYPGFHAHTILRPRSLGGLFGFPHEKYCQSWAGSSGRDDNISLPVLPDQLTNGAISVVLVKTLNPNRVQSPRMKTPRTRLRGAGARCRDQIRSSEILAFPALTRW